MFSAASPPPGCPNQQLIICESVRVPLETKHPTDPIPTDGIFSPLLRVKTGISAAAVLVMMMMMLLLLSDKRLLLTGALQWDTGILLVSYLFLHVDPFILIPVHH